jgi:hypothetical protein
MKYFNESLFDIERAQKENPDAVFKLNRFADYSPEEKARLRGLKVPKGFDSKPFGK